MFRTGAIIYRQMDDLRGQPSRFDSATKSESVVITAKPFALRPAPDAFVGSVRQSCVTDVRQDGKRRMQPLYQSRRQVLVKQQFHPILTLRPISAA